MMHLPRWEEREDVEVLQRAKPEKPAAEGHHHDGGAVDRWWTNVPSPSRDTWWTHSKESSSDSAAFSLPARSHQFPFTHREADGAIMQALERTGARRGDRDYRLLEIIVPDLKGAFDGVTARPGQRVVTLSGTRAEEEPPLSDVDGIKIGARLGLAQACIYLSGSSKLYELRALVLPERAANRADVVRYLEKPLFLLLAVPFTPLFSSETGCQLRELYRFGYSNLKNDAAVCMATAAFLEEDWAYSGSAFG